jgi:hypothetical protein
VKSGKWLMVVRLKLKVKRENGCSLMVARKKFTFYF